MNFNFSKSEKAYESVYWGAFKKFDLTQSEFLTLFLIKGLSKKTGKCYASRKYLAGTLNVSQPTIFNSIKNLVEKELIEKMEKESNGVVPMRPSCFFKSYIESLKGIGIYDD